MSIFEPNNSGTVAFTNGSTAIAGVGTTFTSYRAGSIINIPGLGSMQLAADPVSDTAAVGQVAWQGANTGAKPFVYEPRNEQATFSQKLTALLTELANGNLQAVAGLAGSANRLLMFSGPGALTTVPKTEMVSAIGRAINGLLISNSPTTPNTVIHISPGSCRSTDQTMDMVLPTGWTKNFLAWSVGTGNGMVDVGSQTVANAGYHLFLIYNPTSGAYDFLCSLSATSPVMPSGFTKRRRIGAFATGASGVIKKGTWYANGEFRFLDAFAVVEAAAGDNLTLKALPVPLGVKLNVFGQAFGAASPDVGFWIIIRDPDVGPIANVSTQWYDAQVYKKIGSNDGSRFDAWTDTSGQIYHVAYPRTATNLIYIYLQGWVDLREEFA
ncbi:hypothetical protein [Devosia sp. Root635]|uniref:hypothetical protein n=1 Tax=Devosia sp. Root635 TaxID=1736575 RepID=UPI0006F7DE0C|nr:hypothetical protein [Devosia sp. Root635]KRA42085.1 hypothetical protein ASD80_10180 [Devosia sp. Root635]